MSFATIHTTAGLAMMTDAQVSGIPINLTEMAVGDGNGNPVTPNPGQTALVREQYRDAINRVYRPDPLGQPALFAAELVVPATEGGFTMREVGVFDDDGTLFAVGNLPETYKPEDSEGAFADSVVRVLFVATNADVVSIAVDPNTAVASQQWAVNNITSATVIPGGTTAQILRKVSNADGDTEWADPTETNVTVNTIEETQTLAADQTVIDLAVVTIYGLAVYVDGLRLPNEAGDDGWQADGALDTRIHLGKAYPAGSQVILAQNEPAGLLPEALRKDQNLFDVPDKALARANLDIYSRAQTDQKAPAGMVADFAIASAPTGWLKCNGAAVNRTAYAALFNAIGTTYGAGNGVTTFNLPDFRGEFRRGWDDGRGIDAGRAFGSAQADQMQRILGQFHGGRNATPASGPFASAGFYDSVDTGNGANFHRVRMDTDTDPALRSGAETRPRNIAVLTCIKY